MKTYCCVRVLTSRSLQARLATCGARRADSRRPSSAADIVAEYRSVCRFRGRHDRMNWRSWLKPSSSSRSASSMTTKRSFETAPPMDDDRKWSANRPGVATTMWGRCASSRLWSIISAPPTMTETRARSGAPSAVNWSAIWCASSRAGDRTSAKMPYGSVESACSTGSANAAVFPEPVSAEPTMSRPASVGPMHAAWMGVGSRSPISAQLDTSHGWRPSLSMPRGEEGGLMLWRARRRGYRGGGVLRCALLRWVVLSTGAGCCPWTVGHRRRGWPRQQPWQCCA
eukprot:scaffold11371_cov112-Isochrysis_galbana.AAC.3